MCFILQIFVNKCFDIFYSAFFVLKIYVISEFNSEIT